MERWTIVTGANGGMGKAIAMAVARTGVPVIMACRNVTRSEEAWAEVVRESGNKRVVLLPLDLGSRESIRHFVERVGKREVGVLVNNAGTMCREFMTTVDGLEMTVGVNYVGTWLLTRLLLPLMGRSGKSRVINTTSCTCHVGRVGDDFLTPAPATYRRFRAYPDSKLAVLLFTIELARRLTGQAITVNAVDPGVVNTGMITMHQWFDPLADLFFRPFIQSPKKGARTAILLATSDQYARVSGKLFRRAHPVRLPVAARDERACRTLWEQTERCLLVDGENLPLL